MHNDSGVDSAVNERAFNGVTLNDTQANDLLLWYRWWCYGCLQQAHSSWHSGRYHHREMALAAVHHAALCHRLGITPTLPPAPQPALRQLAQLNEPQRDRVLMLMATVCREGGYPLPDALSLWCRRLAKALRPGLWLPAALRFDQQLRQDALAILHCRFPASCGSRLQLLYPREEGRAVIGSWRDNVPQSRVSALCDAIIWKAADDTAFAGV
ncbi:MULTISPECIES: serine kinase [Dickeya]|uniref:Type III secretion protein HrpD n=1 Tax=Dickeya aquatica TaxID=1401087 RepID=A0A375ABG9_9GAMM|nr:MULTISPECIES: serine kinase [Dickeya]SLM63266.1 type III secretion protein HrpD [Dickeya aquatica]